MVKSEYFHSGSDEKRKSWEDVRDKEYEVDIVNWGKL